MRVRVVNVVNLMTLFTPDVHPHGMDENTFVRLFTREKDVVFAFHGYQRAIHEIVHGRPHAERFHVRGFNEEGTTTTPFDMVVRNGISRYHLCIEALRRANPARPEHRWPTDALIDECKAMLARHEAYVREHLEDMPEIAGWKWT
jgi:xylulose-5-phosphate/fructose-6-phosphate phosphoketolase